MICTIGRWRPAFLILIPLTVFITVLAYEPVSLALYRIREPHYRWPIKAKSSRITIRNDAHGSGAYGAKRRGGRKHAGIDIAAPLNTPVYAAKSGIAFRGNVPTGYGKYVMIYHPDGSQTMYSHLADWRITSTQKVRRGDCIGLVGNTGNAANRNIQPHVHFEIREKGEPVDPRPLLK